MKNYKIQKEERNNIILEMRKDGYTLQAIANKFDCSREWIRKLLKEELGITQKYKFNTKKHCREDEYSANDICKLTGYPLNYITTLMYKNWIPNASRVIETNMCHKPYTYFWKKTDIDKWIKLKIKYLKIALEGYLNCRLNHYPAYKFTHPNLQKRYKLLVELQSGIWIGKLSYNSRRNDEVMKEFYGYTKPTKYVAIDYSKYVNQKTTEDYAQKGLFNGNTTARKIQISNLTLMNYREKGILKEGIHYFKGEHYFHKYMYYPEKTKQAIIDAGYDQKLANAAKKRWVKRKNGKHIE